MNKKGEEESTAILPSSLGAIILAIPLILLLGFSGYKLYNAIAPAFTQEEILTVDFDGFKKIIEELEDSQYKKVKLNLNNQEVLFSISDSHDFYFDDNNKLISYKEPISNKDINFNAIIRPKECQTDSVCICKCKLSESETKEAGEVKIVSTKCEEKTIDCTNLDNFNDIAGSIYVSSSVPLPVYTTEFFFALDNKDSLLKENPNSYNLKLELLKKDYITELIVISPHVS